MARKIINLPIKGRDESIEVSPGKIIAVGLNYKDHVKESATFSKTGLEMPLEPVLFAKTLNTLIGHEEEILIPRHIFEYNFPETRVDPECELAIIIGKAGRHISRDKVFDHILGYTCYNDVSQRNIQKGDPSGWFRGKSFDTFGPIGPCVVLQEECDHFDPQNLQIMCRINGKLVQNGNTRDMIFSIVDLVTYISKQFTLEEGDIIATGTPAGVSPIVPGDVVEVEIEKIGVLTNPVVLEK